MELGCKDKGIKKSEFVAKTQFLYIKNFVFYNKSCVEKPSKYLIMLQR